MADFDFLKYYKPIDYLTPMSVAQEMVERNRNAQTQRMFAENQAKRQSAEETRAQQEFDMRRADEERKHKIEEATAVGTIGTLMHTNPGAAAALAHAYGGTINPLTAAVPEAHQSFDEQLTSALHPDSGTSTPEAPASGNGPGAGASPPADEPVYEGPAETEDLEARRMAAGLGSSIPRETPQQGAELEHLMTQSLPPAEVHGAKYESAASNPLFEVVMGGQHYPLPARAAGTGLGQKYDELYHHAIDTLGMSDEQAKAFVLKEYKDDNAAANISARTAADIKSRAEQKTEHDREFVPNAETKQGNFETLEKGRNARNAANNKARLEAAAMMGGPRQEQADTGRRAQYLNAVKEAKTAAGAGKDIDILKKIEKIGGELNSSSPAAQNAAIDTLAQIAQGGKASIAVMNVFQKHSIGPAQAVADKAYQLAHNGQHSPTYIKSFKDAVRDLTEVANEQRGRAFQAFEHAGGSKSQFAQVPELAPYVANERNSFREELGLPPEKTGPSKSDQLLEGLRRLEQMK